MKQVILAALLTIGVCWFSVWWVTLPQCGIEEEINLDYKSLNFCRPQR